MKGDIMVNLLKKDLLFNKTTLILNMLIYTGLIGYFSLEVPVHVFVGFGCVMMAFLPISFMARDTTVLNCSLPVTRKTLVLSRYFTSWFLASVCLLYILSLGVIVPWSRLSAVDLFSLDSLFLAFIIFSIIFAILPPFVIRFGYVGLFALLISLQLLGAFVLMIQVLFRDNIDRDVIYGVASGVAALKGHLGEAGFRGAVIAALMALNFLSLKGSQALFQRKDL